MACLLIYTVGWKCGRLMKSNRPLTLPHPTRRLSFYLMLCVLVHFYKAYVYLRSFINGQITSVQVSCIPTEIEPVLCHILSPAQVVSFPKSSLLMRSRITFALKSGQCVTAETFSLLQVVCMTICSTSPCSCTSLHDLCITERFCKCVILWGLYVWFDCFVFILLYCSCFVTLASLILIANSVLFICW